MIIIIPYPQADVCQHDEFSEIDPDHKTPQVVLFYDIECHLCSQKMTYMNLDFYLKQRHNVQK